MALSQILAYLEKSYSPYHVVSNLEKTLLEKGYTKLDEHYPYELKAGGKYYVTRNQTSLLAFKVPTTLENPSFHITASHTDSPTFKIKPNPVLVNKNLMSLNVEPYGGGIYSTWMDKPLSIAGRVLVETEKGVRSQLLAIDKDLLIMPNVAIHMNREINSGFSYNASRDTIPLFGIYEEGFSFENYLAQELKLAEKEKVLSYDLFLYNREKPTLLGYKEAFLTSGREDDLASTYTAFLGFLEAKEESDVIPLFVAFDNEEVGSLTRQGAHSTFLKENVDRLLKALKLEDKKECVIASSYLLSIDNAHANHPNHPEYSDRNTDVRLNGGIVIKYNANQSYTSDGYSSSLIKALCKKENLSYQEFTNRSDLRGGSTLGNISNSEISLTSCDIGIAQLSMHSSYETLGKEDLLSMITLTRSYFETPFVLKEDGIEL